MEKAAQLLLEQLKRVRKDLTFYGELKRAQKDQIDQLTNDDEDENGRMYDPELLSSMSDSILTIDSRIKDLMAEEAGLIKAIEAIDNYGK